MNTAIDRTRKIEIRADGSILKLIVQDELISRRNCISFILQFKLQKDTIYYLAVKIISQIHCRKRNDG